jgi:hypothetical protein
VIVDLAVEYDGVRACTHGLMGDLAQIDHGQTGMPQGCPAQGGDANGIGAPMRERNGPRLYPGGVEARCLDHANNATHDEGP